MWFGIPTWHVYVCPRTEATPPLLDPMIPKVNENWNRRTEGLLGTTEP